MKKDVVTYTECNRNRVNRDFRKKTGGISGENPLDVLE